MLAMAHVHGADGLTRRAAAFVRAHSAEVMQTAGWSELVKQPALVNHVFSAVAMAAATTTTTVATRSSATSTRDSEPADVDQNQGRDQQSGSGGRTTTNDLVYFG
jgi:hypothetical protein